MEAAQMAATTPMSAGKLEAYLFTYTLRWGHGEVYRGHVTGPICTISRHAARSSRKRVAQPIAPETSQDVWWEWAQGVRHCTVGTRTVSGLMLAAVWCAGGAGRVARVLARCGGGAEAAAGHRVRGVRLGIALIGLFCGESGVSEGIRRAGLAATGVDMSDMPRYRQRFGTA